MTKNFVSIATHTESALTGSTVANFIARHKELGLKYIAVTDQGFLGAVLKTYQEAKKKDLKTIAGMEIYFKDTRCPLMMGTEADKCKFFQLFVHCKDQTAYQALVKLASKDRPIMLKLKDSEYPLFDWSDLEELAKFNVTITSSGVNCLIGKQFLIGQGDVGLKIAQKLVGMFGVDNVFLSIIPNAYSHYWDSIVTTNIGGKEVQLKSSDKIVTNYRGISKAFDLARPNTKHFMVKDLIIKGIKIPVNKNVIGKSKITNSFAAFPEDLQRRVNKYFDAIAKKLGCRLVLNSYSFFATPEDKIVQDMKLGDEDRVYQSYHVQTGEEAKQFLMSNLNWSEEKWGVVLQNTEDWAELFANFELKYEYRLADYGDKPEKLLLELIKKKGRMKWDDPRYTKQLKEELNILVNNGVKNLVPYFLPLEDIFDEYRKLGHLTGPGRGSAAGFLISYLAGIVHVNPIKEELSSSRFITEGRIKQGVLPDIDCDLPQRITLFGEDGNTGFMNEKYGKRIAQVSTRTLLRLKSAILDANRFMNGGEVEESIQMFSKSLPSTPQGITDEKFVFGYEDSDGNHVEGILEKNEELQQYAIDRPEEWKLVQKCLSLPRQMSRHASAWLLADCDIEEVIPTMNLGGYRVCQPEAKQAEWAGLIKLDLLIIKVLQDIEDCLKIINKNNGNSDFEIGYFMHKGEKLFIWDLPEDSDVWADLSAGNTETVFQLNTVSVTPTVMKIKPKNVQMGAIITSLERPGPKDFIDPDTGRNMVEEYICRLNGTSKSDIPILEKLLPETMGILVFQEQVVKVCKELAKMDSESAENVRIGMGKKNVVLLDSLKPLFVKGAAEEVGQATAEKIWGMMETFARYGFNKSHAVSYIYVSYACAFLKYHYPLEWWASVISNAESTEINETLYKYIRNILTPPDINLSEEKMVIDYEGKKIRSKLSILNGISDNLSAKIQANRPYTDIKDFITKKICGEAMTKKLVHIGVMDSIMPVAHLEEKIRMVDQAIIDNVYEEKIKKGIKAKAPKRASVDPDYIMLSPIKDFQMKKGVYPTMNLDLDDIMLNHSNAFIQKGKTNILTVGKRDYPILKSEHLARVDASILKSDITFACAGYVLEVDYFSYANDTKKACKMIIDSSGYISEKVIWPDRETGELKIPEGLGKGTVAWFMYYKKAKSPYINMTAHIEAVPLLTRKAK